MASAGWLETGLNKLLPYRSLLGEGLATVLYAAAGVYASLDDTPNWWLLAVLLGGGLALQIGGLVADLATKSEVQDLREELDGRTGEVERIQGEVDRARQLGDRTLKTLLASLMDRHGLSTDERVSLYSYNGEDALLQVQRWSHDPLKMSQGRDTYPVTEGLIGDAWQHGEAAMSRLPDATNDHGAWLHAQVETGIPKQAAIEMTMKSRSYVAKALDLGQEGRVGVVVFESTKIDLSRRMGEVEASELNNLAQLVFDRRPDAEKSPRTAANRGF